MGGTATTDGQVEGSKGRPNAPWYVKALLLFHIVCITIWAIPNGKEPQMKGTAKPPLFDLGDWIRIVDTKYLKPLQPIQCYLFVTGVWQYWDMFSPNPMQTDTWTDAEIVYRDGSKRYYLYPRMYTLSIAQKYPNERFRKYNERASVADFSYLWPPFALRIAYLNDRPNNPPVTVRLYRHALKILAPDQPQPTAYSKDMYFEYAVDQRQLAKMRSERA